LIYLTLKGIRLLYGGLGWGGWGMLKSEYN
jgi:hypothetical protein